MAGSVRDAAIPAAETKKYVPDPFTLVVFGASGDLTRRKLVPAIYGLFCDGLLPEATRIVGFARSDKTDEVFRGELRESPRLSCHGQPVDDESWARFASSLYYVRGDYDSPADYRRLGRRLEDLASGTNAPGNRLYYLATPPASFATIVNQLQAAGLSRMGAGKTPWSRIIIEKPFGRDLGGAEALNEQIRAAFSEDQIFRIDHYLGKETVQNLLVLRFANSIFEPIWNQKYVDHVQITASETLGVEGRGKYYDQAGVIRDVVQNHMMHLLPLMAMEPPASLSADAIRNEKVQVLDSLRPISAQCAAADVVRAQYAAGTIEGCDVSGYLHEPDVPGDSATETFVAFKTFIDNWRWSGIPFYLRAGKRLADRLTEISIHFKPVPQVLFNFPPTGPLTPNVLSIRVQPDEGISLEFQVKVPGPAMKVKPLKMDFTYAESFGGSLPDAYQRLLLDAALGDATLFTRSDEIEAAWRFIDPIMEGCLRQDAGRLLGYKAGTWGPVEADELLTNDGRSWHVK